LFCKSIYPSAIRPFHPLLFSVQPAYRAFSDVIGLSFPEQPDFRNTAIYPEISLAMSYNITDMSLLLSKDPINLDEERMFRSFHGGLSPDEYIEKHQLLLPYAVPNCTPAIKAALALEGFEAYDPVAPRRKHRDSDSTKEMNDHDMKAALRTITTAWSQRPVKSLPGLVGEEAKADNNSLVTRSKGLRTGKRTPRLGGPKRENSYNWDGINARLQIVIDQQLSFNASRFDAGSSCGSKSFRISKFCDYLTMFVDDAMIDYGRHGGKAVIYPFLDRKKLVRAQNPTPRFDGPKPDTVADWGVIHTKLQTIIDQQTVFNAACVDVAGRRGGMCIWCAWLVDILTFLGVDVTDVILTRDMERAAAVPKVKSAQ